MMKQLFKRSICLLFIASLLGSNIALFMPDAPKASAAASDGLAAKWQPGNIISDSVMTNTGTMSVSAIQQFFIDKNSTCLKNYVTPQPQGNGNYGPNVSAAEALYDAAILNGINPQVLLVLIQKEQSFITRQTCPQGVYDIAAGYGCPDSVPTCSASSYGFSKQLYKAARFFRIDMDNPSDGNYPPGADTVLYNPNTACGSSVVNIINRATASLYDYTPYQPNASAIAAGYGEGDGCGAYGNRNFYLYFNDWFGASNGSGIAYVKADNGDPRYWFISGNGFRYHIPSSDVVNAWGLTSPPVVLSATYIGSFRDGAQVSRATRDPSNGGLYLVDRGVKYHYTTFNQVAAWRDSTFSDIDPAIVANFLKDGGELDYSVKFVGDDAIYMVDGGVLRQYGSIPIIQALDTNTHTVTLDPAVKARFTTGTALSSNKITAGTSTYLMDAGRKMILTSNMVNMYPGTVQTVASATINRLPDFATSYFVKSQNNPAVYLIDNGKKRHVIGISMLQAYAKNRTATTVSILSDAAINSLLPSAADLSTPYATDGLSQYVIDGKAVYVSLALRAAYIGSNPVDTTPISTSLVQELGTTNGRPFVGSDDSRIFILDGSTKRLINNLPTYVALSDSSDRQITKLSASIFNSIADGSVVSKPFVTNQGTTYYLEANKSYSISANRAQDWGVQAPVSVGDSVIDRYSSAGSLSNNILASGQNYFVSNGLLYQDTRGYMPLWTSDSSQAHDPVVMSLLAKQGVLSIFARSTNGSDGRIFLKDDTKLVQLTGVVQLQNLAGSNSFNPVLLTPTDISNSSPITSSVITVNNNGLTQLVMDGRRYNFADAGTQSGWQQADTIAIGNNLANLLPVNSTVISSVVKSVSQPNLYAMSGASKHWIYYNPYVSRYNSIPVTTISQFLFNALPTGSDIKS